MVGLVVEALRHGGRDARRLEQQEVDDPEVGHVLLRLVELDAERVGARVAEGHPRPMFWVLQRNGLLPSYGAMGAAAAAAVKSSEGSKRSP